MTVYDLVAWYLIAGAVVALTCVSDDGLMAQATDSAAARRDDVTMSWTTPWFGTGILILIWPLTLRRKVIRRKLFWRSVYVFWCIVVFTFPAAGSCKNPPCALHNMDWIQDSPHPDAVVPPGQSRAPKVAPKPPKRAPAPPTKPQPTIKEPRSPLRLPEPYSTRIRSAHAYWPVAALPDHGIVPADYVPPTGAVAGLQRASHKDLRATGIAVLCGVCLLFIFGVLAQAAPRYLRRR